jgi:hypothetical protein
MKIASIALTLASALALASPAFAAEEETDNGTDPTKLSSSASASFEHLDLVNGIGSDVLKLSYTTPLGAKKDYSLQFRVPVSALTGIGNGSYDLGDASIRLTHVFGVSQSGGMVVQGEMVFDTAGRPELGTGQNVFKGTFIYAKFLKDGAIFAPAIVQSNSLWGDDDRADVNNTTLDFYYVPKLANPKNLITVDPSLTFDWEADKQFAGLAVTFGRVLGPALGGNAILSVKPSILAGNDRPADWGIEVNYKIIGF